MKYSGEIKLGRKYLLLSTRIVCIMVLCILCSYCVHANTPLANTANKNYADSLLGEAKILFRQTPNDSRNLASEAMEVYEQIKFDSGRAACLNIIGAYHEITGDYNNALYNYQNARRINKNIANTVALAKNNNNIGNIYLLQGKYERALENYFEALVFYQEMNNLKNLVSVQTNIGLIYKNTGNLNKAIDYYEKAQETCILQKDSAQLASITYNIANIYYEQDDYQAALEAFTKAAVIRERINDNAGRAVNLVALGSTYLKLTDESNAKKTLTEALNLCQKLGIKDQEAQAFLYLGYIEYRNANYAKSKILFEKSLDLATELNLANLTTTNYLYLYKSDSATGNMTSAFNYQSSYYNSKKTPEAFNPDAKLKELQNKYDFLRKEQINTQKELHSSRVLNSYMACGIIVLLLLSFIIFQYIKLKNQREVNQLTQKNLRSQINPHFIFNVLNSIQYYMMQNDSESSVRYLHKFASLLRITLDNSRSDIVPIHDEIESLKLYLELEAMRLDNKLDYTIIIDENIDELMFKIPPLVLQPFVENSIIHGIQKKNGRGNVQIELKLKKNSIHCLIEDDGVGREAASKLKTKSQRKHKSHGKQITETRLNLLNSLYGNKLGVAYCDLKNEQEQSCGTRVEFDLPLMN